MHDFVVSGVWVSCGMLEMHKKVKIKKLEKKRDVEAHWKSKDEKVMKNENDFEHFEICSENNDKSYIST